MTCREARVIQNINYVYFNTSSSIDYAVYVCIRMHGAAFLYEVYKPELIYRFLELFGYTYANLRMYSVYAYYGFSTRYLQYTQDTYFKISPLHMSCYRNNLDVSRKIIECYPKSLDLMDIEDRTPLCVVLNSDNRIIRYILENHKSHVNKICNKRHTPLHYACANGMAYAVKLLLEYGADPNIPSTDGNVPIFDAIYYRNTFKELLKSKIPINFNVVNNKNQTILELLDTLYIHHTEILEMHAVISEYINKALNH